MRRRALLALLIAPAFAAGTIAADARTRVRHHYRDPILVQPGPSYYGAPVERYGARNNACIPLCPSDNHPCDPIQYKIDGRCDMW